MNKLLWLAEGLLLAITVGAFWILLTLIAFATGLAR